MEELTPEDFLFVDELSLQGYGESDSSGCWIKFQVTPEILELMRGRKGELFEIAARLLDNSGERTNGKKPKPQKGPYGQQAAALERAGFFHAPPVHKALGWPDAYQSWCRKQKCANCGGTGWVSEIGEGRCEFAHVRRADRSGTAFKGDVGIPLCHNCHFEQHRQGESFLGGSDQVDRLAADHIRRWARDQIKVTMGLESLTDLDPQMMHKWAEENNLVPFLPKEYKHEEYINT